MEQKLAYLRMLTDIHQGLLTQVQMFERDRINPFNVGSPHQLAKDIEEKIRILTDEMSVEVKGVANG